MSIEQNIQTVKDFFAAMGKSDRRDLLSLISEDFEWVIPGDKWPLAGTYRGQAGLEALLHKASERVETTFPKPPEYVAQGDRVLMIGFATGKVRATNKPFEDHFVFAFTVQNGKIVTLREYVDTQALAQASEPTVTSGPSPS